jgi:hypothetical protein
MVVGMGTSILTRRLLCRNNFRAVNAGYVDSRVPECGTNRPASLPTLCLCRKKTSVYNGLFWSSRAVYTRLNVCRTESTLFCLL